MKVPSRISSKLASLVFVAAALAAVAAFFMFSQTPSSQTTTVQAELPLDFVSTHLETFSRRDVALILNNYAGDAEVVWSGESGGLSGRYRGIHAIRAFLTVVLTNSEKVELSPVNLSGKVLEEGSAELKSIIKIRGYNAIIGNFEGEAQATYLLRKTPEGWRIRLESWDFSKFESEGRGATVFPQWSMLYSRKTTTANDPLKDFIWRLSEFTPLAVAALFVGFAAALYASRRSLSSTA